MRPPLELHNSRSRGESGRTSGAPAVRETDPATKLSSAGVASEGVNVRLDRRRDASDGGRLSPNRIAHGTRTSRPAIGVATTTPSAGASPATALVVRARTRTCTLA